jgi:hypothetical protein
MERFRWHERNLVASDQALHTSVMWRERLLTGFVLVLAAILPFVLTVLGGYVIAEHTRDGRLAMWVILHSQTMTDQQIAHAIGTDPFAVLRRSGMMAKAIAPTVAIIVSFFFALLVRKRTGKLVVLVLTPYFLWDFSMSFATIRTPAQTLVEIAKVLGTNAAYVAMAAFVAVATVRLLTKRVPQERASL